MTPATAEFLFGSAPTADSVSSPQADGLKGVDIGALTNQEMLNSANAAGRIAADPGNPNYDPRWFTNGKLDLEKIDGEPDFPPDATPEQKQAMRKEQGDILASWLNFSGTPQGNFEAGRTESGSEPDRSTPGNPGG